MFTVGLFSTHIPYLAFVVFYAFFFLFGIQKAHAGELSDTDKALVVKISVVSSEQVTEAEDGTCISYANFFYTKPAERYFSPPAITCKLILCNTFSSISTEFDFSQFSRPPPAV